MEIDMIHRIIIPVALTAGLLTAGSAAEARDGCGLGLHRGVYGWCRLNLGYRPYAFAPGYRRWGGPRWHYGYRYGWHRGFAWHSGGHRWGGFRHTGWHHRW